MLIWYQIRILRNYFGRVAHSDVSLSSCRSSNLTPESLTTNYIMMRLTETSWLHISRAAELSTLSQYWINTSYWCQFGCKWQKNAKIGPKSWFFQNRKTEQQALGGIQVLIAVQHIVCRTRTNTISTIVVYCVRSQPSVSRETMQSSIAISCLRS